MAFFEGRRSAASDYYRSKIVRSYEELKKKVDACRILGARVVVTIGSWDMLHVGHQRYLLKGSTHGDVLVVGTDTDRSIKLYKGPHRPAIPEELRMETLSYHEFVTFVTTVDDVDKDGNWGYSLIKLLRPDVFIAVADSYPPRQLREIKRYCGRVVVLPPQATELSSTRIIQQVFKGLVLPLVDELGKKKGVMPKKKAKSERRKR